MNNVVADVKAGAVVALREYPLVERLRDGEGIEEMVGSGLVALGNKIRNSNEPDPEIMEGMNMPKGGYELIIYHCYSCGEFLVRVPNGEAKILEPCPKCKAMCVRAMPMALDIEFTNRCGGGCVCCPRGQDSFTRKVGDMSDETFRRLMNDLTFWNGKRPNTIKLSFLHLFGESISHPKFVEWVNRLAAKPSVGGGGIGTLIVSTNAMPLDRKLAGDILASSLHRLIISLDAVTEETMKKVRPGVDFDRVQNNVDTLLRLASTRAAGGKRIPSIWIQILKLDANQHEWLEMVRKYTQNPRIQKVSPSGRQYRDIPGLPGAQIFCKSVERFGGQYEAEKNEGWDGADKRRFTCKKPWERASIWWDGTVPSPACCYTAQSDEVLGNLHTNSLHGIWLSDRFQKVREETLKYQRSEGREGVLPELCRGC